MIGFIVLVLLSIAGVLYFHLQRVQQQKELYAQYIALNSWRTPTIAGYAKLCSVLDDIDAFAVNFTPPG